ncbi:MAG: hypothetical protein WD269_06610 [Acidimicrobiia bacterium]
MPRGTTTGPALGLCLLLGLVLSACRQPEGGTLVSGQSEINGFRDFSSGPDKSFGIFVCASGGPVTLESAEATTSEGAIEVLGALHLSAEDGFVGAVDGFPPQGLQPDAYEEIEGAHVTTACDEEDPASRDQVILGVSRTGPGGGVIRSVTINYEGGSLEADYTIVLCGDQLEFCLGFEEDGEGEEGGDE